MNKFKLGLLGAAGVVVAGGIALAAGFTTNGLPLAGGSQYPGTLPLTGNETISADTNLPNGQNPATVAVTTSQIASLAAEHTPRNYLDNGAMTVAQQGTGTITGGTTSITGIQFAADRWFVDTNVGSGAGQAAVVTSSPAPPSGFTQSLKLWRNSGALTQPICAIQAIESARAVQLQGKYVIVSAYLAHLSGNTNNVINAYVVFGTGIDQGLATLSASPAINPAWTGIGASSPGGYSSSITPAATWTVVSVFSRLASQPVQIPAGATEVGVELCYTPVGSSSGPTDGFAMTGVQLEPVTYSATSPSSPGPSLFEFRSFGQELVEAQRFFWQLSEPASGSAVPSFGQATGATAGSLTFFLPSVMRGLTPTIAIPTIGTFKVNIAGTPTTWVTPTAGVCNTLACTVTIGNTNTAGQALTVTGGGGSGVVYVKSDVVM